MKKSSGAPDHWVNAYIFVRSISKYIKFILASSYHLLLIPLFNLGSKNRKSLSTFALQSV